MTSEKENAGQRQALETLQGYKSLLTEPEKSADNEAQGEDEVGVTAPPESPPESSSDDEDEHPEFRNSDGTFKSGHPWSWQPGESGNPSGKKKGDLNFTKLTDLMRHLAQQPCTKRKYRKLTWGEAVVKRLFEEVIDSGNSKLLQQLFDRIDGTVTQVHEVEAKSKTIIEYVVAQPPNPEQHEKNKANGNLNGTTKKKGDE